MSEAKQINAFWLGVIGAVWGVLSVMISVALSPWFDWFNNALSDLGVSNVAAIFNSGLIVAGLLASIFGVAYVKSERDNIVGLCGGIILVIACISLIGIGVFSEAFGIIHFYFSVAFFVLVLISSLVLGIRFIVYKEHIWFGVYSLFVSVLGICGWALLKFPGVAIPEAVTAFPIAIWIILLSAVVYRKRFLK